MLDDSHPTAIGFKITAYRYIGDTGVGGDPQDFQQVYDAGTKDAVIKLLSTGSLTVKASDDTALLSVDEP